MGNELREMEEKNNTERINMTAKSYSGRFDNISQNEMKKTKDIKKLIDKILDMEEKQRRSNIY